MASKAVELMKEEMEFIGPVHIRDVQKCQREIVDLLRNLEGEGVIGIGGSPGYVS